MTRRNRLLMKAVAASVISASRGTAEAGSFDSKPVVQIAQASEAKDLHACAGLNTCKGKGGCRTEKNECAGKNDCRGKGGCASTEARHECRGKNACKGQGGCKTEKNACLDKNDCKGEGGCHVPPEDEHGQEHSGGEDGHDHDHSHEGEEGGDGHEH